MALIVESIGCVERRDAGYYINCKVRAKPQLGLVYWALKWVEASGLPRDMAGLISGSGFRIRFMWAELETNRL